jgi:hypothetical protein
MTTHDNPYKAEGGADVAYRREATSRSNWTLFATIGAHLSGIAAFGSILLLYQMSFDDIWPIEAVPLYWGLTMFVICPYSAAVLILARRLAVRQVVVLIVLIGVMEIVQWTLLCRMMDDLLRTGNAR